MDTGILPFPLLVLVTEFVGAGGHHHLARSSVCGSLACRHLLATVSLHLRVRPGGPALDQRLAGCIAACPGIQRLTALGLVSSGRRGPEWPSAVGCDLGGLGLEVAVLPFCMATASRLLARVAAARRSAPTRSVPVPLRWLDLSGCKFAPGFRRRLIEQLAPGEGGHHHGGALEGLLLGNSQDPSEPVTIADVQMVVRGCPRLSHLDLSMVMEMMDFTQARTRARTHAPTHTRTHAPTHPCTHAPTHPRTHAPTHHDSAPLASRLQTFLRTWSWYYFTECKLEAEVILVGGCFDR